MRQAVALFEYQSQTDSELDLSADMHLMVLEDPAQRDDGWVLCERESDGCIGYCPVNYLNIQ
jgi:hypothetical protein